MSLWNNLGLQELWAAYSLQPWPPSIFLVAKPNASQSPRQPLDNSWTGWSMGISFKQQLLRWTVFVLEFPTRLAKTFLRSLSGLSWPTPFPSFYIFLGCYALIQWLDVSCIWVLVLICLSILTQLGTRSLGVHWVKGEVWYWRPYERKTPKSPLPLSAIQGTMDS